MSFFLAFFYFAPSALLMFGRILLPGPLAQAFTLRALGAENQMMDAIAPACSPGFWDCAPAALRHHASATLGRPPKPPPAAHRGHGRSGSCASAMRLALSPDVNWESGGIVSLTQSALPNAP